VGNSPLDYLSTLQFVANRIEPGAQVTFYVYSGNDFVSTNLFIERKVLSLANSLHKLFEWANFFDQWRQASWTYALFRGREARVAQKKTWRYEISHGQTLTVISERDPARYVAPKSLSAPQIAGFKYFLNRLEEAVHDQPWQTTVAVLPVDAEIYANLIRRAPEFVDFDVRRAEALEMCKGFSFRCEDLSRYIYQRALAAGKSPYFENDTHFSPFGIRLVAEHFAAMTKTSAPRTAASAW